MVALSLHRWLPRPALAGLLLLLWAACAGPVPATEIHYLKFQSFRVPFVINSGQQRQIRQIVLYFSEDNGRSYKVYDQKPPTETSFLFHAARDGEYWFTVQAQYFDGHNVPPDYTTAQPGLKIHVDTTPPTVVLRQTPPRDGALGVEWDIRDENPDLMSVRLDYRPLGSQEWIPLSQAPMSLYNQFGWTPTINANQYEVRLQVKDRAGNATEKSIQLSPVGPRPQPPPDPSFNVTASSAGNRVTMINSRYIKLNYGVEGEGKSGVSGIEVWVKRGLTGKWEKRPRIEVPKKDTPLIIDVPEEGRYGFLLIARSGVGRGERPPGPNDPPDVWVEVDETKPTVKVLGAEVGGTPEQPLVTISWDARDKFLPEHPIKILYSSTLENPDWQPLPAAPLPLANTFRYVWQVPSDFNVHAFYLRIEAVDQAGNVGFDNFTKAVVVDLALPKARIQGVEVAPASPAGPPPAAPGGMSGASLTPGAGPEGNGVIPVNSVSPAPLPVAVAPAPTPLPIAVDKQPGSPPAPAVATPPNPAISGSGTPLQAPPLQGSATPLLSAPGQNQTPQSLPTQGAPAVSGPPK